MINRYGSTIAFGLIAILSTETSPIALSQFDPTETSTVTRSWDLTGTIRDGVLNPSKTDAGGPTRLWMIPGPVGGWSRGSWATGVADQLTVAINPCVGGSFCYDADRFGSAQTKRVPTEILFIFNERSTDNLDLCGSGCGDPEDPLAPSYPVNERIDYANLVEFRQPFKILRTAPVTVGLSIRQSASQVGPAVHDGFGKATLELWRDINRNGVVDPGTDGIIFRHVLDTSVNPAMPADSDKLAPRIYRLGADHYIARLQVDHFFNSLLAGDLAITNCWKDFVEESLDIEASIKSP